ncbi:UNVERIFIED_CONTAM: hypothetical protein Sangu_1462400 [Sesamum angustifolium]|uniref:Uncharacterized protein n=1 Tax=Sesamum angustifolium TaxID=2727405 RepID=A0AAW2N8H6_9LAMI
MPVNLGVCATATPPITKSSQGTLFPNDQRGKCPATATSVSSSKKAKSSSSNVPPANSLRCISTPPPPPSPPRDLGNGPFRTLSSSSENLYNHLRII